MFFFRYIFFIVAAGAIVSSGFAPSGGGASGPTQSGSAGSGPTPYPLKYPAYFGNRVNLREDNPLTVEGVALGRYLFYEKRLSRNNTVSCSGCHQQARAFTDGRAFSLGFDGVQTRRNSMSLTNLLWVRQFFWDGRVGSLEEQAVVPLTDAHEMGQTLEGSADKLRGDARYRRLFAAAFGGDSEGGQGGKVVTGERIVKALAQFERTLISSDARYDRYIRGDYQLTASERRGLDLFFGSAGCGRCHGGPKIFNETYHNNGLDRVFKDSGRAMVTKMAYDRGRFRSVTLRNVELTAPYMHDGRFGSLPEVIDHYNEHVEASNTLSPSLRDTAQRPIRLGLTAVEKKDLLAFLHTLTDSTFITDPRFSEPKF
ncbi:MAG: cytochrome-c peroxidase [Bacteroidetes bacterium]|nr:cytochrome-c peroxidase [Bacteroidota bacterium]